jgi:hypothetical protein
MNKKNHYLLWFQTASCAKLTIKFSRRALLLSIFVRYDMKQVKFKFASYRLLSKRFALDI